MSVLDEMECPLCGAFDCLYLGSHNDLMCRACGLVDHKNDWGEGNLAESPAFKLELHREISGQVTAGGESILYRARNRLQVLRDRGRDLKALDAWDAAIAAGREAVHSLMVDESEVGVLCRNASPFPGLGLVTRAKREKLLSKCEAHRYLD